MIEKKGSAVVIILIIFLLSLMSGCTESVENNDGEDFEFTLLDGSIKHLSDYYGKIIILDLMAVNCQPCMYQMFELKSISENYSKEEVTIISIDVWIASGETSEMVQDYIDAFRQQAGIELDWVFGIDDAIGSIGTEYASEGVPTLYILDKKGNIYYTNVGYEPYDSLAEKIDQLLI